MFDSGVQAKKRTHWLFCIICYLTKIMLIKYSFFAYYTRNFCTIDKCVSVEMPKMGNFVDYIDDNK